MVDFTDPDNQFQGHNSEQKRYGRMALNDFGRPEGIFVHSGKEFTIDLDFSEVRCDEVQEGRAGMYQPAHYNVEILGAQFLCPSCLSPCYVKGEGLPGGRVIEVHWDELIESQNDGLLRPSVSIDGILSCDYYDHEIVGGSGGGSRATDGISMKCGWKGGVTHGKMLDHVNGLIL